MATRFEGDGAAANGFGHRTLHEEEARVLYKAGYMAPPYMRVPGDWRLSAGGIPIPPELRGNACVAAMITHYYNVLTQEQRAEPRWNLDNIDVWDSFFRQRRLFELSRYDPGQCCSSSAPPPKVEPKDESSDEDGDYNVFYNRLGLK